MKSTSEQQRNSAWHVTSRADATGHPQGEGHRNCAAGRTDWVGRLRVSIWSFLAVVVLGLASYAVLAVLSGNWTVTPILSGSMTPGLPVGGVAVAERTPIQNLSVRDIVVFQNPNRPSVQVVHRIIKLTYNASGQPVVRTQGDANTASDPWTATLSGKTVYVVQFALPLLGYPAVYTNHGVDLMVGGAILLLVVGGTLLARQRLSTRGKMAREPAARSHPEYVHGSRGRGTSRLGDLVRREVRSINERSGALGAPAAHADPRVPGNGTRE